MSISCWQGLPGLGLDLWGAVVSQSEGTAPRESDGTLWQKIIRWRKETLSKGQHWRASGQRVNGLLVGGWHLTDGWRVVGRCLFCLCGIWVEEGWVAVDWDGREQGMGIKSALILNYSREKNPDPKRSAGNSASPSSLHEFLEGWEWGVWNNSAGLLRLQLFRHLKNNSFLPSFICSSGQHSYLWIVFVADWNLLPLFSLQLYLWGDQRFLWQGMNTMRSTELDTIKYEGAE